MFFPLDYYISELEGLWGQWTFWSLFFVLTDTRSMCYMVCSVDPSQNTASRTKKEKKRKQSPLPFTAPSSSSLLIWGSTIILSLLQLPAELQTQAVSCLVLQTSQSLSGTWSSAGRATECEGFSFVQLRIEYMLNQFFFLLTQCQLTVFSCYPDIFCLKHDKTVPFVDVDQRIKKKESRNQCILKFAMG